MAISKKNTERLDALLGSENFKTLPEETQRRVLKIRQGISDQENLGRDVNLPGKETVTKKQESRGEGLAGVFKSGIEDIKQTTKSPIRGAIGVGKVGLSSLGLPFERMESGQAAALQKIQEMPDKELSLLGKQGIIKAALESAAPGLSNVMEKTIQGVALNDTEQRALSVVNKKVEDEFIAGVKGDKIVEFGDIYESAGAPPKLAAALGLATQFVTVDPLVNGSISSAVKGLYNLSRAKLGFATKEIALKPGRYEKLLSKVDDFNQHIDDVSVQIGSKVKEGFGKVGVGTQRVGQEVFDEMSKTVNPSVWKDLLKEGARKFGITFKGKGKKVVDNTVDNLWKVRRFLDDKLTAKAFTDASGNTEMQLIKKVAAKARKVIAETLEGVDGGKELIKTMDDYSRLNKIASNIKNTVMTSSGASKEKTIRSFFMGKEGEAMIRKSFRELNEFSGLAGDLLRDAMNIGQRAKIGNVVKNVARVGFAAAVVRKGLKGLFPEGGGSGTAERT